MAKKPGRKPTGRLPSSEREVYSIGADYKQRVQEIADLFGVSKTEAVRKMVDHMSAQLELDPLRVIPTLPALRPSGGEGAQASAGR